MFVDPHISSRRLSVHYKNEGTVYLNIYKLSFFSPCHCLDNSAKKYSHNLILISLRGQTVLTDLYGRRTNSNITIKPVPSKYRRTTGNVPC